MSNNKKSNKDKSKLVLTVHLNEKVYINSTTVLTLVGVSKGKIEVSFESEKAILLPKNSTIVLDKESTLPISEDVKIYIAAVMAEKQQAKICFMAPKSVVIDREKIHKRKLNGVPRNAK